MRANKKYFIAITCAAMLAASFFTAVGMFFGAGMNRAVQNDFDNNELPMVLHADSSSRGKGMSFATGSISEGNEGVFVLDHLTGNIQCWITNRMTGKVAAIYRGNAAKDLGAEKAGDADYIMTTGRIEFGGGQGNLRPAECICYVGDGNTGKVVGYSLRIARQTLNQGEGIEAELEVILKGVARGDVQIRDQ